MKSLVQQLVEASTVGEIDNVKALIKSGVDVNGLYNGETALHWFLTKEIALVLLDAGADVNARDNSGETPLHKVVGDVNLSSVLIKAGADLNAQNNDGLTVLSWAAVTGHLESVLRFIAAGADVKISNNEKRTALFQAALENNAEVVVALIDAGSDINSKDKSGKTPLEAAVQKNMRGGLTPLHPYLMENKKQTAITLISYGAAYSPDIDMGDFQNISALTMRQAAVQGGLVDRLQVLLDQHPEEGDGDTPEELVKLAMQHTQDDAAAVLQAYMAARAIEEVLQPAHAMRAGIQ